MNEEQEQQKPSTLSLLEQKKALETATARSAPESDSPGAEGLGLASHESGEGLHDSGEACREDTRTEGTRSEAMSTSKKVAERAVLVTTAHKGVFFGYATETGGATIKLRAARMCVYWSADLRGFMGLASVGPGSNCKIGAAADIELRDITSVSEVSTEAIAKWEKGIWG